MSTAAAKATELAKAKTYRLISIYAAWKSLLLAIAYSSPGPGYDTSTVLLLRQYSPPAPHWLGSTLERLALRLTRWDAIYFTSISERGYVFEQEWAFGGAFARAPALLLPITQHLHTSPIIQHALAAILLSHILHLLTVLALRTLTFRLLPGLPLRRRYSIAFTAGCLHIISPAGIFLSAPNNESIFALLTFSGTLAYIALHNINAIANIPSVSPALAGAAWGLAAAARSNGILAGLVPLLDLFSLLLQPIDNTTINVIIQTFLAGTLIAIGIIMPQITPWEQYCAGDEDRPWCYNLPPSIYQWVQSHYWNVGLFRYWTPGNIPLFIIAMPMLVILAFTSILALRRPTDIISAAIGSNPPSSTSPNRTSAKSTPTSPSNPDTLLPHHLSRLAIPQLALTALALTTFHVQIINRLAAAYPLWYILLSIGLHCDPEDLKTRAPRVAWIVEAGIPRAVVYGMVGYALVQGGLYASFLPPA